MKTRYRFFRLALAWLCFTLIFIRGPLAQASEPEKTNFIILGPALIPEYQGSSHYEAVPMLITRFDLFGKGIEIEGLQVRAGLFSLGRWTSGAAIELDTGRDKDVRSPSVAAMADISFALNAGLFTTLAYQNLWLGSDTLSLRLSAYKDATGVHKGAYATLAVSYVLPLCIPWRHEVEVTATYADSRYMQTYFGVNRSDALAGGLAEFTPGSGIRDVSATLKTLFFFSPQWGLFSRLGGGKLVGEATQSPITTQGSSTQYFAGFGLFYKF